jgi:hypothetical protein
MWLFRLPRRRLSPLIFSLIIFFVWYHSLPSDVPPETMPITVPAKATLRYFVHTKTFDISLAENMLQIYLAMREAGLDVYHNDVDVELVDLYEKVGFWVPSLDGPRYLADIKEQPEFVWTQILDQTQPCPHPMSRSFILRTSHYAVAPCGYLSAALDIENVYFIPPKATFSPYISPHFWNMTTLPQKTQDFVLLNAQSSIQVKAFDRLTTRLPNIVVQTSHGRTFKDLKNLISLSKVIVDTNWFGYNRLFVEGRVFGAVPIFEQAYLPDIPWINPYYDRTFAFIPRNFTDFSEKMVTAMSCTTCQTPLQNYVKGQEELRMKMPNALKHFFASHHLHFVVGHSGGRGDSFRTAINLMVLFHSATVKILIPEECQDIKNLDSVFGHSGFWNRLEWQRRPGKCHEPLVPDERDLSSFTTLFVRDTAIFIDEKLPYMSLSKYKKKHWIEFPETDESMGIYPFEEVPYEQVKEQLQYLCHVKLYLVAVNLKNGVHSIGWVIFV